MVGTEGNKFEQITCNLVEDNIQNTALQKSKIYTQNAEMSISRFRVFIVIFYKIDAKKYFWENCAKKIRILKYYHF